MSGVNALEKKRNYISSIDNLLVVFDENKSAYRDSFPCSQIYYLNMANYFFAAENAARFVEEEECNEKEKKKVETMLAILQFMGNVSKYFKDINTMPEYLKGDMLYDTVKTSLIKNLEAIDLQLVEKDYDNHPDVFYKLMGEDNIFAEISHIMSDADSICEEGPSLFDEMKKLVQKMNKHITNIGSHIKTDVMEKKFTKVMLGSLVDKADYFLSSKEAEEKEYPLDSNKGKQFMAIRKLRNRLKAQLKHISNDKFITAEESEKAVTDQYKNVITNQLENTTFSPSLCAEYLGLKSVEKNAPIKLVTKNSQNALMAEEMSLMKEGLMGQCVKSDVIDKCWRKAKSCTKFLDGVKKHNDYGKLNTMQSEFEKRMASIGRKLNNGKDTHKLNYNEDTNYYGKETGNLKFDLALAKHMHNQLKVLSAKMVAYDNNMKKAPEFEEELCLA